MSHAASLASVSYSIGRKRILDGIDLDVRQGEVLALIGPSGCGKSTLLRLVSGLEAPEEGEVMVFGQPATSYRGLDRRVTTVWQGRALFPHLSVRDNIEFGLRIRKIEPKESQHLVREVAIQLGIEEHLDRGTNELSGGEQQRVALARALVVDPSLILLDEPFTGMDQMLRLSFQADLRKLLAQGERTFILVSHDLDVVLALANRVAVMKTGRIIQVGSPNAVWKEPANKFVANLIGWLNVLPCVAENGSSKAAYRGVVAGNYRWRGRSSDEIKVGDNVAYTVAPQDIRLEDEGECEARAVYRGRGLRETEQILYFELHNGQGIRVSLKHNDATQLELGQELILTWSTEDGRVVPIETSPPTQGES